MMVLWVCVDPMQRQISNLTTEVVLQNKTILKEILITSTWYSNMTTLIGNRKRKTKKTNTVTVDVHPISPMNEHFQLKKTR